MEVPLVSYIFFKGIKEEQMQESIYNIIPKEYNPPAKEPLYKSKFPPNNKPTGSTFCHHTTSKPLVYSFLYLEC